MKEQIVYLQEQITNFKENICEKNKQLSIYVAESKSVVKNLELDIKNAVENNENHKNQYNLLLNEKNQMLESYFSNLSQL